MKHIKDSISQRPIGNAMILSLGIAMFVTKRPTPLEDVAIQIIIAAMLMPVSTYLMCCIKAKHDYKTNNQ